MSKTVLKDPITKEPLPVIIEEGKPKAVVMEIKRFKAFIKLLETMNEEDIREANLLAQSPPARAAIKEGLDAIKQGKVRPWREALGGL